MRMVELDYLRCLQVLRESRVNCETLWEITACYFISAEKPVKLNTEIV